ncbi:MAG: porin family protein [Bacteroidota bacterium]
MKKNILLAVTLLSFGFINAQEAKFGAKTALNIATLTGDVQDASSVVGFQLGVFVEYKLSKQFAFQPELIYSVQGVKESGEQMIEGEMFDVKQHSKLGYLNIPLMIKYYAAPKFSLEFGPQVGFLLSAKADIDFSGTYQGQPVSGSTSVDVKDQASTVDFGLNFGFGYDFTEKFSAGLRYNLGLTNVYDMEGFDTNAKNSVFSIALGYKF